jgi:hypothetical protein
MMHVDDRTRVAMCVGLGALIGGAAGYLLLTERGRELRVELEPRLDDLAGEVQKLGSAFDRTRRAVEEGWRSFNQLVNDERSTPADAWKTSHRPGA